MLEKVWKKGNPLMPLVRMKIDADILKNSMKISKKNKKQKIELPYDPKTSFLGIYLDKIEFKKIHANLCSQQHYLQ